MSEQLTETSTIVIRLEKLEKENRRLKRGGLAVLVLLGPLLLMGQAPASKTVEAQEFNLIDATGKMRASLRLFQENTVLSLYGPQGSKQLGVMTTIGAGPNGPFMSFTDANGKSPMSLDALPPENAPRLVLSDKEGYQTTIGSTDLVTPITGETHKTSAASVILIGKDKKVLWSAP